MSLTFFVACASGSTLGSHFSILSSAPPERKQITRTIFLIADNQKQFLYGVAGIYPRTAFADYHINSAIRPPVVDMFGHLLVEDVARNASKDQVPIIHLGDAANVSCVNEIRSFFSSVSTSGAEWLMTPGNHDGYFMGNAEEDRETWRAACGGNDGEILTKDRFVAEYVATKWAVKGKGLLRDIRWRIDRSERWRSYVAQLVDLGHPASSERRVYAILVDSNQYSSAPVVLPVFGENAGLTGSLLADQESVIESWIRTSTSADFVLMMHHPLEDLNRSSRSFVENLVENNPRIVLLVSAHTHLSDYRVHDIGQRQILEMVIGSLLDWPPEYRTLAFFRTFDGLHFESHPNRYPLSDCPNEFEAAGPEKMDYLAYLNYRHGEAVAWDQMHLRLVRSQVTTWIDLFAKAPSEDIDADASLIAALRDSITSHNLQLMLEAAQRAEREERERQARDSRLRELYKRCKMLWGSKYELLKGRKPEADDSLIGIPDPTR